MSCANGWKRGSREFAAQHGGKPEIVCLRDLGILYIDREQEAADLPLRNRVALVTGAAGAIGYGICRGLLEKGCRVAATDLAGEKLDRLAADLKLTAPERTFPVALDVTDRESVAAGFEAVIRTWGGIDIVVINAGIAMVAPLKETALEAFRRLEKVNVEGTLLTLSATAHHFIRQGTGGDIVIVSTKNVPSPGAGFGALQRDEGRLSPARPNCQPGAGPARGSRQHGGAGRRVLGGQLQIRTVGGGGPRPDARPGA